MKKNKYIGTFILLITTFICSISIYCTYPTIKSRVNTDYNEKVYQYMVQDTIKFNYIIQEQTRPSTKPYDQFFEFKNNLTNDLQLSHDNIINDFESAKNILENDENYYYAAVDHQTNQIKTNSKNNISNIQKDKELQNDYSFYYQVSYDKDGQPTVQFSNIDKKLLEKYLAEYSIANTYMTDVVDEVTNEPLEFTVTTPKNMTITYAVTKDIQPDTHLYHYIESVQQEEYTLFIIPYMIVAIFISILVTLFIPVRSLKENTFFQWLSNIKCEFLSLIFGFAIPTFITFSFYFSIYTMNNNISEIYKHFGIDNLQKYLNLILNIGLWMVNFFLISLVIYIIKFIFHKGFKNYVKENTVIGWIYIQLRKLITYVFNFDFNDNVNKVVLKIVGINFIIICVLCILFVGGSFFAMIYSFILFVILKKKFDEIKKDYEILLKNTDQLSQGNFNLDMDEDIGLFNPLREKFSNIKNGFETAVQEEVKSQKTKTELITNVSHDLKTPLTSIITYIDILKNNDLSDEQRQEYIRILERNSLRLKNLIEDLFEVSKANSGDIKLDYMDVDIISLIKQAQLECQEQFDAKHLEIRSFYSHDKIICYLDSSKTYRILENLLINASKYALENTRVYLDVIKKDDEVILTLKNISKDEMRFNENEIIERFVQGDESRNTSGSGLGLSIVKSFTDIQGGQFKIELDGDLFKAILKFKIKTL